MTPPTKAIKPKTTKRSAKPRKKKAAAVPSSAPKNPYPTRQALHAMLAAGDEKALAFVEQCVASSGGSMRGGALLIGVPVRTLVRWNELLPPLKQRLKGVAMGREGAARVALLARQTPQR